ncbi:MAG: helix-turn-helix domain-containing protein [Nodularia sp. CChRGM 3473]
MYIDISAQDIKDIFEEMSQKVHTRLNVKEDGQTLYFPANICDGWMQIIKLRPGLELVIESLEFKERSIWQLGYTDNFDSIGICFYVSGFAKVMAGSIGQEVNFTPEQCCLGCPVTSRGSIEYSVGQRNIFVTIYIEPALLSTFLNSQFEQFPEQLQQIICGKKLSLYFQTYQMTSGMKVAARQILNCPYQGTIKRLYLESKVIELIAFTFHQILLNLDRSYKLPKLQRHEIDRIHQARDILLSNIENPPLLIELAQKVNLNNRKLKEGFRQVFGTSVFAYLHQYRMEKARDLLESGLLNVTEVAGSVGYTSLSAFNAAFKRQFGVSPSAYRFCDDFPKLKV